MSQWTLFSNHGHVLVVLSRDANARLRDVAIEVGITERAVQKIVRDLQDVGMLSVSKQGRRNCYTLHGSQPLRHALEAHCTVGQLMALVNEDVALMPPPEEDAVLRTPADSSAPDDDGFPAQAVAPTLQAERGLETVALLDASDGSERSDPAPDRDAPADATPAVDAEATEDAAEGIEPAEDSASAPEAQELPADAGDQRLLF